MKKPSWKSTAFIIYAVNVLAAALAGAQQYIPPDTAAIISACLTAVFTIANAVSKLNRQPIIISDEPEEVKKP